MGATEEELYSEQRFLFFFLVILVFELRAFMFARQALYLLSHASSPRFLDLKAYSMLYLGDQANLPTLRK
jgi:hypothetical protein